ncbi:hypothetical protein, partial [Bartonella sp. CL63NXGY]|uniref:hypothetical protein n=1 Tax=Bartonella sp. CL63NXGY TaxID=3243538 RepID=UPI0035D105AB
NQPLIWQVSPESLAPDILSEYSKLILYVPQLPIHFDAWLPIFKNARAIITSNGRMNAFLNEQGIDSNKLIQQGLPFYPFKRPFYQMPPFSQQ